MRVRRHRPHFDNGDTKIFINDYTEEDTDTPILFTLRPIQTRRHNPYLRAQRIRT